MRGGELFELVVADGYAIVRQRQADQLVRYVAHAHGY